MIISWIWTKNWHVGILYKYGGFISDLDMIAIKSFDVLRLKSGVDFMNDSLRGFEKDEFF